MCVSTKKVGLPDIEHPSSCTRLPSIQDLESSQHLPRSREVKTHTASSNVSGDGNSLGLTWASGCCGNLGCSASSDLDLTARSIQLGDTRLVESVMLDASEVLRV